MHKAKKIGFFIVAAALFAATAHAKPALDDDARKAKLAFQQGLTAYNLSHFDEALSEFEKAYRLKADSAFLFNIAQCHRQLNQPQDAIRSYRAFLRESAADSSRREEVQRLITEQEKLVVARDQAAATPPTGVQSPANFAATPAAAPADNSPALTAAPPPAPARQRKSRTWLWVTLGVAGAAVAGAAVGLGVGLSGNKSPSTSLGNYGASFQ